MNGAGRVGDGALPGYRDSVDPGAGSASRPLARILTEEKMRN